MPGGHCRHASGSHRSLRGTITTSWRSAKERFTLEVAVPLNCTAEVHVPTCLGAAGVQLDGARRLRDTVTTPFSPWVRVPGRSARRFEVEQITRREVHAG